MIIQMSEKLSLLQIH